MALIECIPDENDRTFTSGPGSWEGDFTWRGDVLSGHQGYIQVTIPSPETSKTISLAYPAIKPVPGKTHLLGSKACKIEYDYGPNLLELEITDGVYSFTTQCDLPSGPLFWDSCNYGVDIPPDWIQENTILNVTINRIHADPADIALDDFTLYYETIARPQYLPIMGIG